MFSFRCNRILFNNQFSFHKTICQTTPIFEDTVSAGDTARASFISAHAHWNASVPTLLNHDGHFFLLSFFFVSVYNMSFGSRHTLYNFNVAIFSEAVSITGCFTVLIKWSLSFKHVTAEFYSQRLVSFQSSSKCGVISIYCVYCWFYDASKNIVLTMKDTFVYISSHDYCRNLVGSNCSWRLPNIILKSN